MEIEETMPFPPPLVRRGPPPRRTRAAAAGHELALVAAAPRGAALSLEQLTEARLAELRNQRFLWETPAPVTAQEETPAQTSRKIVLASASAQSSALVPQSGLVPLRWRGMPVSPEFQVYALRVSRGEDLAPYRGPILADASLALPWALPSEGADVRAFRKDPRRSARSLFILAALATLAAFVLPNLETSSPEPIAAPAPAPTELAVPAATVPGPLVLESAASSAAAALLPAALPPSALSLAGLSPAGVPLASAPGKAPAKALSALPALPRAAVAANPSLAKRASTDPNKHTAAPAAAGAPSAEATGTATLLVDKPSF